MDCLCFLKRRPGPIDENIHPKLLALAVFTVAAIVSGSDHTLHDNRLTTAALRHEHQAGENLAKSRESVLSTKTRRLGVVTANGANSILSPDGTDLLADTLDEVAMVRRHENQSATLAEAGSSVDSVGSIRVAIVDAQGGTTMAPGDRITSAEDSPSLMPPSQVGSLQFVEEDNVNKDSLDMSDLWAGYDIDEAAVGVTISRLDEIALLNIDGHRSEEDKGSLPPHTFRLKIMGHQNTGTNLALALVKSNLQNAMQATHDPTIAGGYAGDCKKDLPRIREAMLLQEVTNGTAKNAPIWCDDTWSGSGIHKHTPPAGVYFRELMAEPNTVILALMRNPISHLHSLIRRPYTTENSECVRRPTYGGPGSRCQLILDEKTKMQTKVKFSSWAHEWNWFAEKWTEATRSAQAKVLLVSYDELVLQPESMLAWIFEHVGLKNLFTSGNTVLIDEAQGPQNGGEAQHSHDGAIEKIQGKSYLGQQGTLPDQVSKLCKELNMEMQNLFPVLAEDCAMA